MVGRELDEQIQRDFFENDSESKFSVDHINITDNSGLKKKIVDDVSLSVKPGEVLGLAGLRGSGSSELLNGLFGAYGTQVAEKIVLNGKEIRIRNPREAINNKVALLTNNRKTTGLVLPMTIVDNICLPSLDAMCENGWRKEDIEKSARKNKMKY